MHRPLIILRVGNVIQKLGIRRRSKHGMNLSFRCQLRIPQPPSALTLGAAGGEAGPRPELRNMQ